MARELCGGWTPGALWSVRTTKPEPNGDRQDEYYLIPGSGFRLLVGEHPHIPDRPRTIRMAQPPVRRRRTEKDFLRLQEERPADYEKVLKKLLPQAWAFPEDSNACPGRSWRRPSSSATT